MKSSALFYRHRSPRRIRIRGTEFEARAAYRGTCAPYGRDRCRNLSGYGPGVNRQYLPPAALQIVLQPSRPPAGIAGVRAPVPDGIGPLQPRVRRVGMIGDPGVVQHSRRAGDRGRAALAVNPLNSGMLCIIAIRSVPSDCGVECVALARISAAKRRRRDAAIPRHRMGRPDDKMVRVSGSNYRSAVSRRAGSRAG